MDLDTGPRAGESLIRSLLPASSKIAAVGTGTRAEIVQVGAEEGSGEEVSWVTSGSWPGELGR